MHAVTDNLNRRSFRLSSIFSWFGSVPVGSELATDIGHRYSGAGTPARAREDSFRIPDVEKRGSGSSSPLGWPIPTPPPVHAQIVSPRLLSGALSPSPVEHGLTPAPRPKAQGGSGTHRLSPTATKNSTSNIPLNVSLSRGAGEESGGPLDTGGTGHERTGGRDERDPFSDARDSAIGKGSM